MKAYLIGGLAADERVFRHIRFPDHFETVFLNWLIPEKNESLRSYAIRMSDQMDRTQKFILVGVSFGGMLAVEINKIYPAEKLILVASISDHQHLPGYFRWMHRAGIPKMVPIAMIKKTVMIRRIFTAESDEDKNIIRSMIKAANAEFIRWAIIAALEWDGNSDGGNFIHIHGTSDIVFPIRFTNPSHRINHGGHLMVMERADDINKIIEEVLN